jgi:hypothetical protein
MDRGNTFTAALLAVVAVQIIQPHSPQLPYWQTLAAAAAGTLVAWGMRVTATRLKSWRSAS